MTPADLHRWLDEEHLSRRKACLLLDLSQDRLRRMLAGDVRIPGHIALACAALAERLPEWPARAR